MSWAESRLTINQIKSHPFFYGADWNALRLIEPPFVPRLQSITDTSYFPTDDFGNVPDQLSAVEGVGAEKDLAFLGYGQFPFHIFFTHATRVKVYIQTLHREWSILKTIHMSF